MITQIQESVENKLHRTCQKHNGPADYYCIRCNWRGDHPESPRQGEQWHSCPVCRGHTLPWERRMR